MTRSNARKLSHFNARQQAVMVNVGGKPVSLRTAEAQGRVDISPALAKAILRHQLAKGDLLAVARLAGIMAAKRTAEFIPLCHPIPLESIDVKLVLRKNAVHIRATVGASWKTGVEMEALHAVAAAALTVYDMGKAVDRDMVIRDICLTAKTGGTRGDYRRANKP